MKKLTKNQIQKKQENIRKELEILEEKLIQIETRKVKLIEDYHNLSAKLAELENQSFQAPEVQKERKEPSQEAKNRVSEVLGF